MAKQVTEPDNLMSIAQYQAVPIEIGFTGLGGNQKRCILTFQSYSGDRIRFAPSEVVVVLRGQQRIRPLTREEHAFIRDVRQAPISARTTTERFVLAPHNVRVGPYPWAVVSEFVATILKAIENDFLDGGRPMRITFLNNWPKDLLNSTLNRLSEGDCQRFIAECTAQK